MSSTRRRGQRPTPLRPGRDFPYLGDRNRRASAATRAHYFVTGPYATATTLSDGTTMAAGGILHAKKMGTLCTACGVEAMSWPKLWDVPFRALGVGSCPACAQVVGLTGTGEDASTGITHRG